MECTGYTKQLGSIALKILLQRIKTELPLYERRLGAVFFEENYTAFYNKFLRETHSVCPQQIPHFSQTLATLAYADTSQVAALQEPSDCFLWMCFEYVLCIHMQTECDVSQKGIKAHLQLGHTLGLSQEDTLAFFEALSKSLWEIHTAAYRRDQDLRLVS